MSRPRLSAGISSAGTTCGSGVRSPDGNVGVDDDVGRQHDLDAGLLGPLEVVAAGVELVVLEQALADLVALGLEEGEHHAAADQQLVGLAEQVVDDAELVGDLRAAEHHDVRALRVDGQPAQHVDLGRDQAAHGVREPLRDVVHGRLLAVHDAEAVGHERVGERGELVGERAALGVVLAGLARVEPDVLQHRDLAVLEAVDGRAGADSPTVSVANATVAPEQLAEACRRPGAASTPGRARPSGRPRWAATTTRAPASASFRMVGTLARIRPSSVIVVPSSGTFRSERTRTRLPRRSPRLSMPCVCRARSERRADVA